MLRVRGTRALCTRMPHSVKKRANAKLTREEIPELTFESPTLARRGTSVCEGTGRQQTSKESGKRIRGESDDSTLHLDVPGKATEKTRVFSSDRARLPHCFIGNRGRTGTLNLDTGSSMSILQPGVSKSDVRCTAVKPYAVAGETLDKQGQQCVSFRFSWKKI